MTETRSLVSVMLSDSLSRECIKTTLYDLTVFNHLVMRLDTDRGTERQFRFTRALLCTLLGVKSEDTITSHVDKLLKRGAVTVTKFLVTVKIANSVGAVNETTHYRQSEVSQTIQVVFWANSLDHSFGHDYKSKKKRRMDSTSNPPVVIQNGSGMTCHQRL